MTRIVVIGGGWAGCSAAVSAKKSGADQVVLLERTDMLLGTGLVGGIMRNNGRFTATEELLAMGGGGDIFEAVDKVARHRNIDFPGHKHATLYDVARIEPAIRKILENCGVKYNLIARVRDITMEGQVIKSVITDKDDEVYGDIFIEATGTAGPQAQCSKYGNGCAMCIIRCPTFGTRISIAARAGIQEMIGRKADGSIGAMSGSCKLHKDSLSETIVKELNTKGVVVVPIPESLKKSDSLRIKACQQYALKEFAENIILLDTGHAKLMTPYYPLNKLRQIPGFESARYEDPYSGGIGNSIRFTALSPRDNALKVQGLENLFCSGEKAGLLVGHTEAIVTGTLAGHNAVRQALGEKLLVLPETLAIGDAIAHVREQMQTENGLKLKYTFSGAQYFKRMQEKGLYTTDIKAIQERVEKAGLSGVFSRPVKVAAIC